MKKEIDPCKNFHDFVCGNFQLVNPISPYYNAISATDRRVNEINDKISVFLETPPARDVPPILHKIQTFYRGCLDEGLFLIRNNIVLVIIQQKGLETLHVELSRVDLTLIPPFENRFHFSAKYLRMLAKIHRNAVLTEFLFDVSVQIDPKQMRSNQIIFGNTPSTSQASMNFATEGLYSFFKFSNVFHVETEPDTRRYNDIQGALRTYMLKVVTFMNAQTNQPTSRFTEPIIEETINFLIELEKTRKIGKYNRIEGMYRTTVLQLQDQVNLMENLGRVSIEWSEYFTILFAGLHDPKRENFKKQDHIVLIQNFGQFKQVLQIVTNTKKDVLVFAMWWVVVQSLASIGPKSLQEYREEYLRAVYRVNPTPRRLTCLNLVRSNFGYFVGYMLAKDKRSEKYQQKVIEMVNFVKDSMYETIEEAEWMDQPTKVAATTKLNRFTAYTSFWNTLTDPALLQQTYGPVGDLNVDIQDVPIGALGYPIYDLGLEALNYGALASQIASQLWHLLDASGRNFDQHGNGWYWWSAWSTTEYEKREQHFREFYGGIPLQELGRNVDGVHTAIENVADLVGFETGLRAYHKYIENNRSEKKLVKFKGYTHEKLFTLAFANMHCVHASLEYVYGQVTEDENPPQPTRVNGVMMNSKEFSRIWNCSPNVSMNPDNKCHVIP